MNRRDIILLLLKAMPAGGMDAIVGTTRLQKLIFLLEKEGNITPTENNFDFVPYKFGPASKKLYDDLEFLSNLGLIERSNGKAFDMDTGSADIDSLSVDDLLSEASDNIHDMEKINDSESPHDIGINDTVVYRLTEKGRQYLQTKGLINTTAATTASNIKRKYSKYSLSELLGYVYSKYPSYTIESEIKDKFCA